MRKLNKKLKREILLKNIIISLTLLFFTGCGSTIGKAKILLPPSWIGMQKIAPNVYVDEDMNKTEQKNLML